MLINEIPEPDRPREKLAKRGAGALSDAELLAIFLRTGRRGRSAISIASELIEAVGSLSELSRRDAEEIQNLVSGIGPAKACELCAAVELGHRLARGNSPRPELSDAGSVYDLFAAGMQSEPREVLKVALLDTKLRLIRDTNLYQGSVNECLAHPRDIFRPAVVHNAYGLIVIHNHPSGDPAPSSADRAMTRRLAEAASLLQINLLDHVIIGNKDGGRQPFFSFKEAGLL
jgi:DNA repair protein RadC